MPSPRMARPGRKPPRKGQRLQSLAPRRQPARTCRNPQSIPLIAQERACNKAINPITLNRKAKKQVKGQLHMIPAEVRDMIFKAYFEPEIRPLSRKKGSEFVLSGVGTTPALLIALRADKELYYHALVIYYQINRFAITKSNFEALSEVPKHVFPLVRSIVVRIDGVWSLRSLSRFRDHSFHKSLFINPRGKTCVLAKVTGLTSLTFQLYAQSIPFAAAILAQQLPLRSYLTEIKFIVLLRSPLENALFECARWDLDKLLGVNGIEAHDSRVDLKVDDEEMKDAVLWSWIFKAQKYWE